MSNEKQIRQPVIRTLLGQMTGRRGWMIGGALLALLATLVQVLLASLLMVSILPTSFTILMGSPCFGSYHLFYCYLFNSSST